MQLQIPTIDEIRIVVREEIAAASALNLLRPQTETDEIGGIELAIRITGKARPTIYALVSARQIPHLKQGKRLYFSRNDLIDWLRQGKRKTHTELALDAETFSQAKLQPKNRSRSEK